MHRAQPKCQFILPIFNLHLKLKLRIYHKLYLNSRLLDKFKWFNQYKSLSNKEDKYFNKQKLTNRSWAEEKLTNKTR